MKVQKTEPKAPIFGTPFMEQRVYNPLKFSLVYLCADADYRLITEMIGRYKKQKQISYHLFF